MIAEMRKLVVLAMLVSTWLMLTLAADTTWDLTSNDGNTYSTFLGNVRGQVKATNCFGIPMLGQPSNPEQYVFVSLKSNQGKTIRLALTKKNLYVVGYSDTFNNKPRAFYFKGDATNAFPGAQVNRLWYTGSYQDLQGQSKTTRKNLGLSKTTVNRLLNGIHGKAINTDPLKKDQAQFLLLVVQMVAEAVRFRYIETEVKAHYAQASLTPNQKVLAIVTEWGKISDAMADAKTDGTFQKTLALTGPDGKPYTVKKVDEVRNDIAVLKYVPKQCARKLSHQIITRGSPLADMLARA